MLTKGTRRRSASQIAEEIERVAGTLQGHSGKNSLSVEMEVLSRYLDEGLDLLADVLLEPAFDPKEVKKQRADTLAAIRRREDDLAGFTVDTFAGTFYRRHPYRFTTLGTPKSVNRLTRRRLQAAYARLAVPSNLVIAAVGDVNAQDIVERLSRRFGGMRPRLFRRPPTPREKGPARARVREVHKEKAQAHLMVGFPGTTLTDPDKYAIEVMSTALAGQGGRLFLELRDRQSLAYTVTSFSLEGVDPGYVAVYMGTSPGKLRRALAGVRRELALMRRRGITPEELERAKRYLVGSYEIDLQRASAQASALAFNERYGLGIEEYRAYPEKILEVTAEDVLRVARKVLRVDRPVIALVRPAPRRSLRRKA
jgi:zinc protease